MSTKRSPFQPDHLGRQTPVKIHDGMIISHTSHGVAAGYGGSGGPFSGRDGKPKHIRPTPVHPASHRVTGTNEGAPTITTLDRIPDASSPCALDPTKPGKQFVGKSVPTYPGMRSRTTRHLPELGRAILQEAFNNSSRDDCDAHGYQRSK